MKKYKQVKVNLDPNVHADLHEKCEAMNITIAEYFRRLIDTSIDNPRSRKRMAKYEPVDPKLLYEIRKIGVNLNQIARHTNAGNPIDTAVLAQLVSIEDAIKELI